jgi:hypothetical protein
MEIIAIFEIWHIGDLNYPPLSTDMFVNLSFEVGFSELAQLDSVNEQRFHHLGGGEYEVVGEVLQIFQIATVTSGAGQEIEHGFRPVVVIEADGFRFYTDSSIAAHRTAGALVRGKGILALDYYVWNMLHTQYADAPDLFYNLRVERIERVRIPDQFIRRTSKTVTWPARLRPGQYSAGDVTMVDEMTDDEYFRFYVVTFSDRDLPAGQIPGTFMKPPDV